MIEVGLLGSGDVGAELRDRAGRLVSSARFTHGRAGRWRYAAAGPYHCGQRYTVVYEAGGVQTRLAIRVAARVKAARGRCPLTARRRGASRRRARPPRARARRRVRADAGTRPRRAPPRAAPPSRRRSSPTAATGRSTTASTRDRRSPSTGAVVAFDLPAAGLVPGDRNGVRDVFVRDAAGGRAELVSVARGGGVGNGTSRAASISADGRLVAFESSASDLVAGDDDGVRDVFVRDRRSRHDATRRPRPQPGAQRRRALRRVRGRRRRGRRRPRRRHAAARRDGRLPPRAQRRRALRRATRRAARSPRATRTTTGTSTGSTARPAPPSC